MSPGGCLANPAVIALNLHRLRDLKHVAQSFVFNDRALIDFGRPVVLPARQNTAVHPEFDTPIPEIVAACPATCQRRDNIASRYQLKLGSYQTPN
ncbi:hypothetical protein R75465_06441 [Paraburkholderia aspalathi]|nr:hypothetical protein R75465_06441 [Paraburkholderia aspalathi]